MIDSASVRRRLRRVLPAWVLLVLGVGMAMVGAFVATRPDLSITVLVMLVGGGFAAAGIARLLSAAQERRPWLERSSGGGLLLVGVAVLAWPGTTVQVLARLIGVGLLLSGAGHVVAAIRGRAGERLTSAMGGLAGVGFGLVVLGWPRLTLFVTGIVFGAWLVFFGLSQVAAAVLGWRRPRPAPAGPPAPGSRRRLRLRAAGAGVALVAAVGLVAASIWVRAGSPAIVPDAFYTPPTDLPAAPGRLLRSQPLTTGVPKGAQVWRILYTTTMADGVPAVASGTVLAPVKRSAGLLPVLSVSHGTTGIVPGCAPSLSPAPFADGAGTALARLVVDHGWAGVISDYVGLGTAGPHAYLVGEAAARNVLDATRAARQLGQLRLDRRTVVWGHSQGGHGAIWAGAVGPRYAPELEIVGVAALAPATDLEQLATGVKNTTFGRVVSAYLADSWAAYYPQLDMDRLVDRRHRRTVSRIGRRCFSGRDALAAAAVTSQLFGPVFTPDALSGTVAELLRANSPHELVPAPLLVAQGDADPLVLPAMQRQWVAARCTAGQRLDFRSYPGLDHLSLVAADSPLTPVLVAWAQARLAGDPARSTC